MAFLVEVAIRRAAHPYRVGGVPTQDKAREIVESALAAWGIAAPDACTPAGAGRLLEQLAETGEYVNDAPDYRVSVRRCG